MAALVFQQRAIQISGEAVDNTQPMSDPTSSRFRVFDLITSKAEKPHSHR